jgi:pyridoxine kinase
MGGKTVVAISSFVMRGAVGLRAVQYALERRGHVVWSVPTVLMPWHPGLGRSTRTVPADLAAQLAELATRGAEVDAVVTGYFADAATVTATAHFIDAVRGARPDVLVMVDPVIGDDGGRYVPDNVAEAIADELVQRANILTPNLYELEDLSGGRDVAAVRSLGVPEVAVTSGFTTPGRIGAMLVTADEAVIAEHDHVEPAPRGTGDLFGAVYLSARLAGRSARDALREVAAATFAAVGAARDDLLPFADEAVATPPVADVVLRAA